jgi:aminoglycoside phosphotransferase family enzyme/predicted kinase
VCKIDSVTETHVSWVTLVGDRAYKRKKPVRTGFLDFSTVEARRRACEEEVRVNRRLAPDVYLGVDPVLGCNGDVCDYVVVMRRMPAELRLSTLVAAGVDVDDGLRRIARRVAALHLNGERSAAADAAASAEAVLARWEANDAELAPMSHLLADPALAGHAVGLARRYVAGRRDLFADRVRAGRAVDGHGDLLADDIFALPDGPRILDAIEFDARLRLGDGLADIAFLAMDLERLGAPELARRLLGWYAEFAGDRWPASLAHFYIAYRAQVRAKVACLRAAQESRTAAPEADALLSLAVSHLEAGRCALILVGGPPATGKTTIAAELGARRDWVVLRSDHVRKELAGLTATTPAAAPLGAGVYSPTMTALAYGELLHRAGDLLAAGESVVLDATWGDPVWRAEARRVAERVSAELVELRCSLPVAEASERARRRRGGEDASDAGPEIAAALAERFAPWPQAAVIDTAGPPDQATDLAEYAAAQVVAA